MEKGTSVGCGEGRLALYEDEDDAPERPPIHLDAVSDAGSQYFGRRVVEGSAKTLKTVANVRGEAKVGEDEVSIGIDEDVGRFEISVDDVSRVNCGQRRSELGGSYSSASRRRRHSPVQISVGSVAQHERGLRPERFGTAKRAHELLRIRRVGAFFQHLDLATSVASNNLLSENLFASPANENAAECSGAENLFLDDEFSLSSLLLAAEEQRQARRLFLRHAVKKDGEAGVDKRCCSHFHTRSAIHRRPSFFNSTPFARPFRKVKISRLKHIRVTYLYY